LTFRHEKLSTYGIGKSYSARQWRHLSRQFLQKGLIVQELEHDSLKLTAKAWEVLRGKSRFGEGSKKRRLASRRGRKAWTGSMRICLRF
jgi:superfamily II DNA helicase RecQ